MLLRTFGLASLLLALLAAPASAHFVWITIDKDSGGQPQLQVHFSELAEPDSADLLDRVSAIEVWTRPAGEQPAKLKLSKQITDSVGSWVAPVAADTQAASGSIKYGVLERGGQTFLLWYHAKFIDATANLKGLGPDKGLALDIVPQVAEKGYTLEVAFKGKPVAGSEVVVLDPEGNESTAKTDEAGRVSIAGSKPGVYSIRAKWTLAEAGKEGDKAYPQVNHYCTLALRVPQPVK
ncbi:MAG: DUF4198 domain-containing protein [Pirellulaceae bacterium]